MFGRDTCRKTCQLEKMHGVGIEPATERDESSARGRVEIRERERFDIVKRSHEIERFRLPTTQRQRRVFDDRDTETFLKCGSRKRIDADVRESAGEHRPGRLETPEKNLKLRIEKGIVRRLC